MTAADGLVLGARIEARTGPIAHGGHVVARIRPDGAGRDIVVFVRHALPGELVVVEITEVDKTFLRGDAVEVIEPSPDRVPAPCPLARPDGCGGCDFQHVALPAQRVLKSAVVQEQLRRLAGIEREVIVEAVDPTLRWRTRMQYVALPGGRRGLRKHRSHDVVEVADCLIAAPGSETRPDLVTEHVLGHDFTVAGDGFWQVHPEAPRVLVEAVLGMLAPRPGERAVDLYAGVGLFSAFLAEAVGAGGHVTAVEGDRRAVELAGENLAAYSWAEVRRAPVERLAWSDDARADVVVLDPPRVGAKRKVVDAIAAARPRAVAYVACDPAALARDVAYFRDAGYALAELRAFDLFPMTHHIECVALLRPTSSDR